MSYQNNRQNGDLVPAEHHGLALVAAANPLVSRGLADLALGRLLHLSDAIRPRSQEVACPYDRGMDCLAGRDYDRAIKDFGEAIRLDPKNADAYLKRAWAWMEKEGRWDLMFVPPEEDLDEAVKDSSQAWRLFQEAIGFLDEVIRLDPQNADAYLQRGNAWLGKDMAARILRTFGYLSSLKALFSEQLPERNEFAKAMADFDEAVRLDPQNSRAFRQRGEAWTGKPGDNAIQNLNEAIRLDPQNAEGFRQRGEIWYSKKEYGEAIQDFDQAIRLDPNNAFFRYLRGTTWGKGDEDKAIRDFNEAIRLDASSLCSYFNRGCAWFEKKEYDKAIKDWDDTIRLDPRRVDAYNRRACAWLAKKHYDKAIEDYEAAIRLVPCYSWAYRNLAWLLATCPVGRIRDGKRAIEMAKKAGEEGSSDGDWALDTLAAAYAEAGQFDEAVRCQTQVLNKDHQRPDSDELRQRLALYKQKRPFRQST